MSDLTVERVLLYHMREVIRLTEEGDVFRTAKHREASKHERKIRLLVGKMFKVPLGDLELGHWACEKSPTARCFYNNREDGALDHCLVCGGPDERK